MRQPLMLSDTAMLMLRYSVESSDHIRAVEAVLAPEQLAVSQLFSAGGYEGITPDQYFRQIKDRDYDLMHDLWLAWTFQDIPLRRSLDWHLVFNEALTQMAETMFISFDQYKQHRIRFMTQRPQDTARFMGELHRAYRSAAHNQTKTTP